jgi:hypothetical protein
MTTSTLSAPVSAFHENFPGLVVLRRDSREDVKEREEREDFLLSNFSIVVFALFAFLRVFAGISFIA